MYKIKNAQYGNLIEEQINPTWVKQQERVDRPILADSYDVADGVVLSDGNTMLGIAGRRMDNYTPLVVIEEVNGEPYLMAQLEAVQAELTKLKEESSVNNEMSQSALAELLLLQAQQMEGVKGGE